MILGIKYHITKIKAYTETPEGMAYVDGLCAGTILAALLILPLHGAGVI